MKRPEKETSRSADADPANADWPDNPLDQFAEEHLIQREDCAALDRLAALTRPDRELAAKVLHHLDTMWVNHIHDEENALFPLLRQRSSPEDDIYDTLKRLAGDHSNSLAEAGKVRQILQDLVDTGSLPGQDDTAILAGFSAHKRRHLIVENGIVLPLARVRLTDEDLASLRLRMIERRAGSRQSETP